MLTGADIINSILTHFKINANQLAKNIGLTRTQGIYDILDGKINLSKKMADKLVYTYPELNRVYLLSGQGEMLLQKKNTITITFPDPGKVTIKIKTSYVQRLTSIYKREQQKSTGK